MSEEYFDRERLYQATISIARAMLQQGLVTEGELAIIDMKMREKYRPILGALCPVEGAEQLDFTALQSD